MSTLLISGAAGFIGQHLARSLLDDGYSVRGLFHGKRSLYFLKQEDIEWREMDLSAPSAIKNIAKDIHTVYHLAAMPEYILGKTV